MHPSLSTRSKNTGGRSQNVIPLDPPLLCDELSLESEMPLGNQERSWFGSLINNWVVQFATKEFVAQYLAYFTVSLGGSPCITPWCYCVFITFFLMSSFYN